MFNLRLVPVVIFAMVCLFGLKTYGLMYGEVRPDEGYSIAEQPFWKIFAGTSAPDDDDIITGATPDKKNVDIGIDTPKQTMGGQPLNTPAGISVNPGGQSPSEKALTERLQERRA
jgi:hypothetical protein